MRVNWHTVRYCLKWIIKIKCFQNSALRHVLGHHVYLSIRNKSYMDWPIYGTFAFAKISKYFVANLKYVIWIWQAVFRISWFPYSNTYDVDAKNSWCCLDQWTDFPLKGTLMYFLWSCLETICIVISVIQINKLNLITLYHEQIKI